jgi:hypothetical protein
MKRSRRQDHSDLTIISSSWKPKESLLSQRLQPPLPILVNILSYIEHEIHYYDGVCGVNKQWLMASQRVPNTIVRNKQDSSNAQEVPTTMTRPRPNASSFRLAIRKYPYATSFLGFPSRDLKSLLDTTTFNLLSLRSLSLSLDGSGFNTIQDLINRLLFSSSFELSLNTSGVEDKRNTEFYQSVWRLLDPFNDRSSSDSPEHLPPTTVPSMRRIRLDGHQPHPCEGGFRHGWTWSISCSTCGKAYNICCEDEELDGCARDGGCGTPMVIFLPTGRASSGIGTQKGEYDANIEIDLS